MNAQHQEFDLGFTTEVVPDCHHLCLIFDDEAQRHKIVSEYLAAGLNHGELVRYFADVTPPQAIRTRLIDLGVELSQAEEAGSFGITRAEDAYCPNGHIMPQDVVKNAKARYAMAQQAGYRGSRVCGEMTWVLRRAADINRLLEYEARLNLINEAFPYIGMCQYDARQFDGATLFKVLQVHPYMIAQGQIVRNPFYVRPEEFLEDFTINQA
jgi:hypothetical protein